MGVKAPTPEDLGRLPTPKGVALAIMQACQQEDTGVADIARLVAADPALTGRLIQLANSAAAGARPVASASDAVARMGLQSVRRLALGFSLIDQYEQGPCAEFDYAGFWSHSLFMAVATRELGSKLGVASPDELFTCGLLARVGCLALATVYPREYSAIVQAGLLDEALLQRERQTLGTDHIAMSALLQAQWGIPGVLAEPARLHEHPNELDAPQGSRPWLLVHLLHLSLRLADFMVDRETDAGYRASDLALLAATLGIAENEFAPCVDRIVELWRGWSATLRLAVTDVAPFSALAQTQVRPDQEPNKAWFKVLIVEDEPVVRRLLERWLRDECHYTVMTANDGQQALTLALDFQPHLVMTDLQMPVMDGLELCRALRESAWGQNIYILMLTSADSEDDLVRGFDAGVDDYLTKPVKLRALSARLKAAWRYVRLRDAWERDHERLTLAAEELAQTNRSLQMAALSDPLTELANRRAGLNALSQAWSAATRHGHALSVIAIDVDRFKDINDTYGHSAGDLVLQRVSQSLREAARREDTVCRWGGEEFLVICPNMPDSEGLQAAQRFRAAVAALRIAFDDKTMQVTISLGVATWRADMASAQQLLSQADKALYAAKQRGRNCVAVANPA